VGGGGRKREGGEDTSPAGRVDSSARRKMIIERVGTEAMSPIDGIITPVVECYIRSRDESRQREAHMVWRNPEAWTSERSKI